MYRELEGIGSTRWLSMFEITDPAVLEKGWSKIGVLLKQNMASCEFTWCLWNLRRSMSASPASYWLLLSGNNLNPSSSTMRLLKNIVTFHIQSMRVLTISPGALQVIEPSSHSALKQYMKWNPAKFRSEKHKVFVPKGVFIGALGWQLDGLPTPAPKNAPSSGREPDLGVWRSSWGNLCAMNTYIVLIHSYQHSSHLPIPKQRNNSNIHV